MKNMSKILMMLLGLSFISCDIDEQDKTIVPVPSSSDAAVLLTPVSDLENVLVLTEETKDDVVFTATWTGASYKDDSQESYQLYVATAGTGFAKYAKVGNVSTSDNVPVTVTDLNSALSAINAPAFTDGTFELRLMSFLGKPVSPQLPLWSNTVTIKANPFPTTKDVLYVIGDFQSDSGYGNNNDISSAPTLLEGAPLRKDFEGFVYFKNPGSFKLAFRDTYKVRPDLDYGNSAGKLGVGGEAIAVTEPGMYYITVNADPEKMTYTVQKTDWAIVGSSTPGGWPPTPEGSNPEYKDTQMTYDIEQKKYVINIPLTAGAIKFRANNTWTLNFGGDKNNLTFGGGDLNVAEAGNYTVTLDLSSPREYKTVVKKN